MRAIPIVLTCLTALVAACGGNGGGVVAPPPPPPQPGPPVPNATVTAGATTNVFTPSRVDITQNGTVTWSFGALVHNVTFSSAAAPANIGDTSNQTEMRTFANTGTFEYTCTLHPGMNGMVVVH